MNYFQIVLLGISFLSIYSAAFFTLTYSLHKDEIHAKKKSTKKPTVSIIASVWNEEKNMENWIQSVLSQTYPVSVYVVNDKSSDGTHEICKKYADQGLINYYVNKKNKGKVINQNFLVKNHVKTDLFCVLDCDCFYEKDAVEHMVKNFDDSNVAAVVPTTKVHGAKSFLERVQMVEYYLSSFVRPIASLFNGIYTTNGLTMFKTKYVKEVGYFDAMNLTEDMDMCMKLYSKGYKIKGDIHPHAYTLPVKKLVPYLKQRRRWQVGFVDNFFNHYGTINKYPGMKYVTFPMAFAWVGILTGLFMRLTYNITTSIADIIHTLQIIDYDWKFYLIELLSNPSLIRINIVTTTMLISSLIFISLLSFSILKVENRKKLRLLLNTPLYVVSYSILLTLTWLASYLYMITSRGQRQAWTHQT